MMATGLCSRRVLFFFLLFVLTVAPHIFAGQGWKRLPTDEEIHAAAVAAVSSLQAVDWGTFKRHDPSSQPDPTPNKLWKNEVYLAWIEPNPNYIPCDANDPDCAPLGAPYWCGHTALFYENGWAFDPGEPLYEVEGFAQCTGLLGDEPGWIGEENQQNRSPTVSLAITSQTASRIELFAKASDPDGDKLAYEWYVDGSKTGATNPDAFWNDPPEGTHTIRVVVSDGKGGMAEDSVTFTVGAQEASLFFDELRSEKDVYALGETVKVIYYVMNTSETLSANYHVEYKVLNPSNISVYSFVGTEHALAPGVTDRWQSTKWVVPRAADKGRYTIVAKLISNGKEVDQADASFDVLSEEIEVSYTLGYDLPITAAVPLRVHFALSSLSHLKGIVGVTILKEGWLLMPRCPLFSPQSDTPCVFNNLLDQSELKFSEPGRSEVDYDFHLFHPRWGGSVNFTAQLDLVDKNGKVVQRQVEFSVLIEAAFTVKLLKAGVETSTLGGTPLPLKRWVKGSSGQKLRVAFEAVVAVRHLAGLTYVLKNKSADLFWDILPAPNDFYSKSFFKQEEESVGAMVVQKVGTDKALDQTLEILFEKTGKKAAGPLGLVLDIFEPAQIGGNKVAIRLRSTVGMTIDAAGGVSVRTFEGDPEVIQPDGSAMKLPVGYETFMEPGGRFSTPVPYDPTDPSVTIWNDEFNLPPPNPVSSVEAALDVNVNGQLDDEEIRAAIQYWILGQTVPGTGQTIDDEKIRELIQMWILGEPVGTAAAAAASTAPRVRLSARGDLERELDVQGAWHLWVKLFDLSGHVLARYEVAGSRLRFSLRLPDGSPLANGVYFYVVTVQGAAGTWRSPVKKLMVLR